MDDVGSGVLDAGSPLLEDEPTVRRSVAAGAELVTFSGDKLLGGPQAGMLVGRGAAIAACRAHPLARALRIDKLSLAALAATLQLHRDPELARRELPVLAMLDVEEAVLAERAQRLASGTGGDVVEAVARVGGGALPLLELRGPGGRAGGRPAGARRGAARPGSPAGRACAPRHAAARSAHAHRRGGRPRRRGGACRSIVSDAAVPLTVGTAGHIDHGKTALVRALTGRDTDRLPEERARGMSIDLGFAQLDLGARRLSLVDVPGHERFVRTMVAGATGVDLFLLVVAADDGVMPQTIEHAAVLRALEVRTGMVAITKADLADPERARAEVRELVDDDVPVVACSTRTGEGVEAVRAALAHVAAGVRSARTDDRPAVLHVDRSFTVRGAGTVVTGTLWAGSLGAGDRVTLLPSGRADRVRGVQVHDTALERASAGQRVAVNLGPGEGRLDRARRRRGRRGRRSAPVVAARRRARAGRAPPCRGARRSITERARRRRGSRRAGRAAGSFAASAR